jgi:GDPmannose 4,6-dehydratase
VIATGEMHSVRDFVEAAFRHVGKEIEWEGEAENEVGKEKGTDIVRIKINAKYYRPTEVEQLQVIFVGSFVKFVVCRHQF